jgi:rod shape-determining protein MreD
MIMPPGERLLMPVRPAFVWMTLVGGLLAAMLANMLLWGRAAWAPDILSIVLLYWTVHQTRRVGMFVAFVAGLLMDVHQGGLLGQHALAYVALSYLAVRLHRRLRWFSVTEQAVQVFPLFAFAHLVEWSVSFLVMGGPSSWWTLVSPVAEALLWPLVGQLLVAPQRRAPDPDKNRPI